MPEESSTPNEQLAITVPGARAARKGAGSDPGPGAAGQRGCQGTCGPGRAAACGRVLAGGRGVVPAALRVSGRAPLYSVYQAQWRFSATTLTAVFAVYVLVLLVTAGIRVGVGLPGPPPRHRRGPGAARARAGCSSRRTVSGCCSRPGRCRAPLLALRPARAARR